MISRDTFRKLGELERRIGITKLIHGVRCDEYTPRRPPIHGGSCDGLEYLPINEINPEESNQELKIMYLNHLTGILNEQLKKYQP